MSYHKRGTYYMGIIRPDPTTGLLYKPNKGFTQEQAEILVTNLNKKELLEEMI